MYPTVDRRNPAPGKYPKIYKVLYIPGGAGFLPSTVVISQAILKQLCLELPQENGYLLLATPEGEAKRVQKPFQSCQLNDLKDLNELIQQPLSACFHMGETDHSVI